MKKHLPDARHSLFALGLFTILVFVRSFGLNLSADENLEKLDLTYSVASILVASFWIQIDQMIARKHTMNMMAAMAGLAWPFGIPIYLFATRGRTAMGKLAIAVGVMIASTVLGGVLGRALL